MARWRYALLAISSALTSAWLWSGNPGFAACALALVFLALA